MKKILYIDSHSPAGHINFNKIYLREIEKQQVEIHTVFRKDYFNTEVLTKSKNIVNIPNFLYPKDLGKFINRIFLCFQLLYVKNMVKFSDYDYVILSVYDEIALFFSGIKCKMFLVNHDNARGFESKIKTFFLKQISKYHTHIVFLEEIKELFINNKIDNVILMPHGLVIPFENKKTDDHLLLKHIDERIVSTQFNYILFSPSRLSDTVGLETIINNHIFLDYIKKNKILLIFKNKLQVPEDKNLLTLKGYLTEEEYRALFNASNAILISYPKTFKLRVSGVLFECFANNKQSFILEINAFKYIEKHFAYYPFFNNACELITLIENSKKDRITTFYKDLELLQPNFSSIIDEIR